MNDPAVKRLEAVLRGRERGPSDSVPSCPRVIVGSSVPPLAWRPALVVSGHGLPPLRGVVLVMIWMGMHPLRGVVLAIFTEHPVRGVMVRVLTVTLVKFLSVLLEAAVTTFVGPVVLQVKMRIRPGCAK